MSQEKRKSLDGDLTVFEEADRKKIKVGKSGSTTTSLNGADEDGTQEFKINESAENETTACTNGADGDGTEEYDLETPSPSSFGSLNIPIDKGIEETGECSNLNDKSAENLEETNEGEKQSTSNENGIEQRSVKFRLKPIESVQADAEIVSEVVGGLDLKEIYDKILKYRKEKNRIEIVSNEIIDGIGVGAKVEEKAIAAADEIDDQLFKELSDVLSECPNADPSQVYDMLVSDKDENGRTDRVLKVLSNQTNTIFAQEDTTTTTNALNASGQSDKDKPLNGPFSDPSFMKNPLYKDMKTLIRVLPDKDPNEVYAFLEAHFDKPNRVQVVIDELTASESQESLPIVSEDSLEDTNRGKAPMTVEEKLISDLKHLREIFKDCDPNFLHGKLEENSSLDRVQLIAAELFEKRNYPKLKDIIEEENTKNWKKKVTSLDFDLKTFLKKFPDPVAYFSDTTNKVNDNYKEHVVIYMKNTYPFLKVSYIRKVLGANNHHLAPAVQAIDEELPDILGRRSKKKRLTPREEVYSYPDNPDEPFFQEVVFVCNRHSILDHLAGEAELRKLKIETARSVGELIECGCCYDDECLFEEMAACADGHIFCKECIRRSCEAAIGEGKTKFPCLTGTCELDFPLQVLQELLPATTFSLALRKMQEEELRLADIPDLVSCPYCSFATIMSDPDDKVFKCLNPECLKESCRLCKEPNHVPLKCSEVEKQCATNMRTFIEMKVSEAMLRVCRDCKKRFYKDYGCNKMTCTCGASMCYVCRAPNIDYGHFEDNSNNCKLYSSVNKIHDEEMSKAAVVARDEYLTKHPDQDPGPEFDIDKMIQELKTAWEEGRPDDDVYEEEEEEEEEDDDDDEYYDE